MDLEEVRRRLEAGDKQLDSQPLAFLADLSTPHGHLRVSLTDRLRRRCRKGHVWMSHGMLTALKNASYGFDPKVSRSRGGADGIFAVDRAFHPPNAMMKKLFAQFLDKPDPLVGVLAATLASPASAWFPVRLVSHHLRLLGIVARVAMGMHLVLVDYDNDKE